MAIFQTEAEIGYFKKNCQKGFNDSNTRHPPDIGLVAFGYYKFVK